MSVALPNVINGLAGGLVWVPLTTMTMSRLRKQEIGNAAGIFNLMRNIGGSVGIASVTTMLVRGAQAHQNYLAGNVTAGTPAAMAAVQGLQGKFAMEGASAADAHRDALGMLYRGVQQQATVLTYADNFRLLGYLTLACIPLVWFFHRVAKYTRPPEVSGE